MALWKFMKGKTTEDTVEELLRRMEWIFAHLDSKNVKRLDTNETVIKSKDGKTIIVGPLLLMYDENGDLRLKQGLDESTNKFVFELINGIITGGLIRTALDGARVELTPTGIKSYNASEQLHGIVFDPAAADGNFALYYNGVEYFKVKRYTVGIQVSAFGVPLFYYHTTAGAVWPDGNWDFTTANVTGLEDSGYATQYYVDGEINDVKAWVTANFEPKV